ncbi:Cytochrome bo(3) ubiquinol oxidase subunit 3 [Buchnera aphidicola (Anoecia corni)]|uniref:Cytochrome bo(3) ubiquinol oxidase subunit 3 n=1 Tax=Buchnera aphidicola (Anoecia corni) TaxID=2994477 RepID=A0AAT9IGF3_9GAMM
MIENKNLKEKKKLHYEKLNFTLDRKKTFGFWIYLMSDCIIFATLFSVYSVMHSSCPYFLQKNSLFKINIVSLETAVLLLSSVSYGTSMHFLLKNNLKKAYFTFFISFILGCYFIFTEYIELYTLILNGYGPTKNAFLSSFFTLLATHGIHVFVGIIWMVVLIIQLACKKNYSSALINDFFCLGLFWHFLDIIWICIYTFVYLIGAL